MSLRAYRHSGKGIRSEGKIVRGPEEGDCLCGCALCADCITLFQDESINTRRSKTFFRGFPASDFVFKNYKSITDTWGAYVPPDYDEFDQPIAGTGNPPFGDGIYFNMQICHRLLISPFINGSLDEQTGDFTTEYVLKTNRCGFKPFEPCACFGGHQRPFAVDYDSQTGTLLDTFPYWSGPPTTQADCPALSATGAAVIASVDYGDCPPDIAVGSSCCRVGGYAAGSAAVLPTWDWLQSRSWWTGLAGPDSPLHDARLILIVGYMTMSKWQNEGGMPEVRTWIESQPASDSGARVVGAFLSKAA